jgi:hypothetical protein
MGGFRGNEAASAAGPQRASVEAGFVGAKDGAAPAERPFGWADRRSASTWSAFGRLGPPQEAQGSEGARSRK